MVRGAQEDREAAGAIPCRHGIRICLPEETRFVTSQRHARQNGKEFIKNNKYNVFYCTVFFFFTKKNV